MIRHLLRALPLRHLPLSDYYRTRLWSAGMPRPHEATALWPYHRCIELAVRGMAKPRGYGTAFPGAGDPSAEYTMLEFGVAAGRTFQLLLHFRDVWRRRLRVPNTITALGFDTFAGMPDARDGDTRAPWNPGDFAVRREEVQRALERGGFRDFELVPGLFAETLRDKAELLRREPPLFVAIDCDYYSSTIDILDAVLPVAPHGCLFYFDDVSIDFYSDRTGELKAIAEVNAGRYGPHLQLVEYPLWIETREIRHYRQMYRLVNLEKAPHQVPARPRKDAPTRGRIASAF